MVHFDPTTHAFGIGNAACDIIGLAEFAFDFHKKRLHCLMLSFITDSIHAGRVSVYQASADFASATTLCVMALCGSASGMIAVK